MARRVMREGVSPGPWCVLDAQPLSLLADNDRAMMSLIEIARQDGYAPAISAVTIAEVRRAGQAAQRLRWLRSRLTVVPVTEPVADLAAELLEATGLDGHECVVDSLVVATAAGVAGSAKVVSSDGSRVPKLCAAVSVDRASPVQWVRV
ncbi:DNA-binding protein [Streptomyces sp. B6B3]|uniref:type II toxin-antitoxin system VapC family toxin n=1 Tax=Streptomyces sp. B6B3 TaxID=3153570 RepID=UPI00325DAE5E